MTSSPRPYKSDSQPFVAFIAATGCGFVASLLAIYIHLLLYKYEQMSFYTWMAGGIVPVGAILLGIFAAGGYFIGASLTQYQPRKELLLSMILIAMLTQAGMYFVEYMDSRGDDYTISYEDFRAFVDTRLTEAVYTLSSRDHEDADIPVGEFGYVLALLQLGGFMAGGLICYAALRGRPSCRPCGKYLKYKGAIHRYFESGVAYGHFRRRLDEHPPLSPPWLELVASEGTSKMLVDAGAMTHELVLRACPSCRVQLVEQDVQMATERSWHTLRDQCWEQSVPADNDLGRYFDRKKSI